MKKITVSIAFACYLLVTTGVVINHHYCMKRLASVQLFASAKVICGDCGMHTRESNGCCHDEIKVVKLEQDQNTFSAASLTIPAPDIAAIIPSAFITADFFNDKGQAHFHNHSPPLLSAQDIYLQINTFRI